MKKLLLLTCLMTMTMAAFAAGESDKWINELLKQSIIKKVEPITTDKTVKYDRIYSTKTYQITYRQPINHQDDQTPTDSFDLRALISVNKDNPGEITHVYVGGYDIDNAYLDSLPKFVWGGKNASFEISRHYIDKHPNAIMLEHRFYGKSIPAEAGLRAYYYNAKEAAADFHELIQALKTVLKGKWIMSGISKGGIVTTMQQAFHPNDFDVYVPYSAPFLRSDRDPAMQNYWDSDSCWTPEVQQLVLQVKKKMFSTPEVCEIFSKYYSYRYKRAYSDTINTMRFFYNVAKFDFRARAYGRHSVWAVASYWNDVLNKYNNGQLVRVILQGYSNYKKSFAKNYSQWLQNNYPQYATPKKLVSLNEEGDDDDDDMWDFEDNEDYDEDDDDIDDDWWDENEDFDTKNYDDYLEDSLGFKDVANREEEFLENPYRLQAKRELGYFDILPERYITDPQLLSKVQAYIKHFGCTLNWNNSWVKHFKFRPDLRNMVTQKTKESQKPIIFLYGKDDTWTGAAMPDSFINKTTVFKYILERQNHSVSINGYINNNGIRQDIWDLIDKYMLGGGATLLGDANEDGKIDVADITTIAEKILGKNPAKFNAINADVNKDGRIDVADITATASLILNGKK